MKKLKTKSAFQEWFVKQYGPRPSGKPTHVLEEEHRGAAAYAEMARSTLEQTITYDLQATAALYAWSAKDSVRAVELERQAAEPTKAREDGSPSSPVERQLRRMLCVYASGPHPYMDDGEAQDGSSVPFIDFLRETPEVIQLKLGERGRRKWEASAPRKDTSTTTVRRSAWQVRPAAELPRSSSIDALVPENTPPPPALANECTEKSSATLKDALTRSAELRKEWSAAKAARELLAKKNPQVVPNAQFNVKPPEGK